MHIGLRSMGVFAAGVVGAACVAAQPGTAPAAAVAPVASAPLAGTLAPPGGWDVGKFAQVLTGIAALAALGLAYETLDKVHLAKRRADWLDSFRLLYREFWQDDEIAEVRLWMVNDRAYETPRAVLLRRQASVDNTLDAYDNAVLEKIDRFCALMVRVHTLGALGDDEDQERLWFNLYGRFWLGKLQRRDELKQYIRLHWPVLEESAQRIEAIRRRLAAAGPADP